MNQNARLNRGDLFAVVERPGRSPGLTEIARPFEMHPPSICPFAAAGAKYLAVSQLDGFVLNRAEDSIRQPARLRPRFALIIRGHHHPPPGSGTRARFVKEQQRSRLRLE